MQWTSPSWKMKEIYGEGMVLKFHKMVIEKKEIDESPANIPYLRYMVVPLFS